MLSRFLCVLALATSLFSVPAFAAEAAQASDWIGVGFGTFDFARSKANSRAVDMKLDYRWAVSLLPLIDPSLRPLDSWIQVHPFAGIEGTEKGQFYGVGGFAVDIVVANHIVITPNVGFGLYAQGAGKDLGAIPEFRSTLEAGWRFDNGIRMVGYAAHISNAGIGDINPGAEMMGLTFHIPTKLMR